MLPRFALVVLGLLVLAILGIGIWVYTGGPFRLWVRRMAAGGAYMRSLKEDDMSAWIDRSTRLLAEYRPGLHPVGVYDGVVGGKPIPPELQRLKIVRIDIFEDRICYVWMGGMTIRIWKHGGFLMAASPLSRIITITRPRSFGRKDLTKRWSERPPAVH